MEIEDIKVGEYVRTKEKGAIGKVIKINYGMETDCEEKVLTVYCLDCNRWTIREQIKNHSKEIIDLVEEDDYVNGKKVKQINCKLEYIDDDSDTGVSEVDNGLEIEGYPTWIYFDCEIESIVTKEQFNNMKYKVGK